MHWDFNGNLISCLADHSQKLPDVTLEDQYSMHSVIQGIVVTSKIRSFDHQN
jgi:hypothetical protein